MVLVKPEIDKKGKGYQINQSKVAIGSGGFLGQGFLQGTQTKFDFVPEQSTDFIFCTIGEEHGWLGSAFLIILYVLFLVRIYQPCGTTEGEICKDLRVLCSEYYIFSLYGKYWNDDRSISNHRDPASIL